MKRKILYLLALLSVCHGLTAQVEGELDAPNPNYVIQPADVLQLQVFQEPDLTQELRVPKNGKFQFPLIGTVELKGKTIQEAEDLLRELYDRDYLVNPQINLLIIDYSQRRVNVMGAVNNPGVVIFPPDEEMTLLDAISRAGSFNRLGNKKAVTVRRTDENGKTTRYRINTEDKDSPAFKLENGDQIDVPEKFI